VTTNQPVVTLQSLTTSHEPGKPTRTICWFYTCSPNLCTSYLRSISSSRYRRNRVSETKCCTYCKAFRPALAPYQALCTTKKHNTNAQTRRKTYRVWHHNSINGISQQDNSASDPLPQTVFQHNFPWLRVTRTACDMVASRGLCTTVGHTSVGIIFLRHTHTHAHFFSSDVLRHIGPAHGAGWIGTI
jgi:hypothetical protein